MTEIQFLLIRNNIFLQITKRRRWLTNHKFSNLPADITTKVLNNTDYVRSIIRTGSDMKVYPKKEKDDLGILIFAINTKYRDILVTATNTN